jgi:hypothetical protein
MNATLATLCPPVGIEVKDAQEKKRSDEALEA